ncbi:hypothetical protein L2E82_42476 [Cichorium intybus]|uniref:Uncharacterized protein n=1 Tax=Cichorium intybus TaxID=13427 RepID=A0ACB8ZLM8_CICIN|nr:hypothetical protein L2E82_42476 [Cichorium intybus]
MNSFFTVVTHSVSSIFCNLFLLKIVNALAWTHSFLSQFYTLLIPASPFSFVLSRNLTIQNPRVFVSHSRFSFAISLLNSPSRSFAHSITISS